VKELLPEELFLERMFLANFMFGIYCIKKLGYRTGIDTDFKKLIALWLSACLGFAE